MLNLPVKQWTHLFDRIPAASAYSEQVLWLEKLVDWIRAKRGQEASRIRQLLNFLELNPAKKQASSDLIASIIYERPAVRLFSEMGVPSWTSLPQEVMSRLGKLFVPVCSDQPNSLNHALAQVFYDHDDARWLSHLPEQDLHDLLEWVRDGLMRKKQSESHFLNDLLDAALILVIKSGAISVREDFAIRSPRSGQVLENPLLRIQEKISYLRKGPSLSTSELREIELSLFQDLSAAEEVAAFVKRQLEEHGVTIDLIYQRDRLKLYLTRIHLLLEGVFSILNHAPDGAEVFSRIFITLVKGNSAERDFFALVRTNLSFISKKIIDFTGNRGFNYIAQNPAEYRKMFWLAAGGGMITAFTVMFKYAVQLEGFPLFVEYFYAFLNYSISFVIMDLVHFKLATKQPTMTAAALASKMEKSKTDEALVDEFAKITRSQFSAVLGNIVGVIPFALFLDWMWTQWKGHTYLTIPQAQHVIESINPLHTGTVLYAAMTGLLLWLSGVTAGWVENSFVFHRIPELIRTHRALRQLIGEKKTARFAQLLTTNISGLTSAVSLGFYLALWPVIGKFFGLPLDIRHITLTTGSVTMAIHTLGLSAISMGTWVTLAGAIFIIGWMNFTVSFILAMFVAIRAKDLNGKRAKAMFRQAFDEFRRNPLRFILQ